MATVQLRPQDAPADMFAGLDPLILGDVARALKRSFDTVADHLMPIVVDDATIGAEIFCAARSKAHLQGLAASLIRIDADQDEILIEGATAYLRLAIARLRLLS